MCNHKWSAVAHGVAF